MRGGLITVALFCLLPTLAACTMLGGFSSIEDHANDASVQAAKDVAVKEITNKLGAEPVKAEVLSAERQVVAGTNYKLKLLVETGGAGKKYYEAQVWEKLPAYGGEMTLSQLNEISATAASS